MIAIPALDKDGPPNNARGASRAQSLTLAARDLADFGFSRLQISGRSAGPGLPYLLEDIVRDTGAKLQVEGVTATNDIDQLLRLGVDHVVVGARGIDEPEWLADVSDLFPDSISIATDVHDRRVVRRGWVRTLPVDILDLVDELNGLALRELIVHVPSMDTATRPRELALLEDVAERSRFPVLVSGAVRSLDDCRALEHRGIAGAVIDAGLLLDGAIPGRDIAGEFGG